jgi:hypothetical protein
MSPIVPVLNLIWYHTKLVELNLDLLECTYPGILNLVLNLVFEALVLVCRLEDR